MMSIWPGNRLGTPYAEGFLMRPEALIRVIVRPSLSAVPIGLDGALAPTLPPVVLLEQKAIYTQKLTESRPFDLEDGGSMNLRNVNNTAHIHDA
jgi:hypothetical protein